MQDINKKIIELMQNNNLAVDTYIDVLHDCISYVENNVFENLNIEQSIFYSLKDIVWYNFEHLPAGGEKIGISNLRFLSTKFPNFISIGENSFYVKKDTLKLVLQETEQILAKWNKDLIMAFLYTKTNTDWDKSSSVIIYNSKTESPSKYGFNKSYGGILNSDGKKLKNFDINTVLCSLDGNIGEYSQSMILFHAMNSIRISCLKAIQNNKILKINFIMDGANNA